MKKYVILCLLAVGVIYADTIDQMARKIAGLNKPLPVAASPSALGAFALVDRNNEIKLSAYNGALVVDGANFDSWQTTLAFQEPTADKTITFKNAAGTVELVNVTAKDATATLTAAECWGGVFTNTGASGAIVLTLPTPVAGMHIRVYLTVAQDVDLNAATSTQILALTNATGDAISSAATIGNSIELVAISATQWVAFASSGTWTDVN